MPAVLRQGKVIATCDVCGRMAHWGFGKFWGCAEHLKQVEEMWVGDKQTNKLEQQL